MAESNAKLHVEYVSNTEAFGAVPFCIGRMPCAQHWCGERFYGMPNGCEMVAAIEIMEGSITGIDSLLASLLAVCSEINLIEFYDGIDGIKMR